MYYLRKQSIEKLAVTDGRYTVKDAEYELDRALYKHKKYNRFYRSTYPDYSNDLKLWTAKSLKTALQQRVRLWYYCNEWFDIYDDNGKISEEIYLEYKPKALYKAKTTRTLYYSEEEGEIVDDKPTYGYYDLYRSGTVLKIYKWLDWYAEWDFYKDINERLEKESQLVAVTNSGKHLFTFTDEQDFLEENCWFEILY